MLKLFYGAAYYPELWPAEAIEQDIDYMLQAGIDVVRMGEFAWAKMEPNQDEISLDFFVEIINRLDGHGIRTVFCTPTPTPPIWLSHGHPERMYVTEQGVTLGHGARQHPCTNNPFFRERSRIIVEAVAKAVGSLPGLLAWQTDNEFKCHVAECCCAECAQQWHAWLKARYQTIDALNDAWGAEIWSERYQRFDQVPQPTATAFVHNASLSTAYRIFAREKIAEFQHEQVEIIRRYSKAPITHNSNRGFKLDNELLFRELDFAAFDNYPDCDNWQEMVLDYELWRTVKKGRPFWVMETSTSHNGWLNGGHKPHRAGFVTAEAVAAYAYGAEGFSHWLWRQQRAGCEQNHGAVLSAWGKPTIGFDSVMAVDRARNQLEPILQHSTPCQAEIAVTYSDRARTFFLTEGMGEPPYTTLLRDWHDVLLHTGILRDLIFEGASLDGYKILSTPFVPFLSPRFLKRIEAFVRRGGVWIAGPLTGGRTREHTLHTDAALGALEALAGVETVFTYPLGDTGATGTAFGQTAPLSQWSAVFTPRDARVLGTVHGGLTPDHAFITERQVGDGKVVLLGSLPTGDIGKVMLQTLFDYYARETGITLRAHVSYGTLAIPRHSTTGIVWIIVNMDGAGGHVRLPGDGIDMLSHDIVAGGFEVGPYAYRIINATRTAVT